GVDVTSEIADKYNVPIGVYVNRVVEGSGAEAAGLQEKDVITAFNGRSVTSMNTLNNIMKYIPAGTEVEVTVAKASKHYEEETVKVTLTHRMGEVQ
ncbi:MAG: PDZ domain-containing protein, partial [Pseudobutyrivibrio sp.]|nr:PDZ domain-containing protein [Pseudobutyrivibrio sp.]